MWWQTGEQGEVGISEARTVQDGWRHLQARRVGTGAEVSVSLLQPGALTWSNVCFLINSFGCRKEWIGQAFLERVLFRLGTELWRWREMEDCVLWRLRGRDVLMSSVGDEEQTVTRDEE